MSRKDDVVKNTYGALLTNQGRGYYVTLEFLALVRGTMDRNEPILPESTDAPVKIDRRSHHYARRLMAAECSLSPGELSALGDETTLETLAALIAGLRVPIPGRLVRPNWLGEHLYPYIGEMVHYDAAQRGKTISIERYAYRGAGGLAHKIIRTDPNRTRLMATREALSELVADGGGALGRLFQVLSNKESEYATARQAHGEGASACWHRGFEDDMEHQARIVENTCWIELLRSGVHNISVRADAPRARRVEALMHWVPYCIARHQLALSEWHCGETRTPLVVEFGSGSPPVRKASRLALAKCHAVIDEALERVNANSQHDPHVTKGKASWRTPYRTFFSATLGTVGALNAMKGTRHFTCSPMLLESVVMARLSPRAEVPFEEFCAQTLFAEMGLVVDATAAAQCDGLRHLDRSRLDENVEAAADALAELGLLQCYSDMTRMVRGEIA